jgi:cytidylate kinase
MVADTSRSEVPVIAIDGPLGSGKGTISMRLAERLGWHLLDSGALYRLVAIAAMEAGVEAEDAERLTEVARHLDFEFRNEDGETKLLLAGRDVGNRLRTQEISSMASRVAAIASVRAAIVGRQRAFLKPPGLVADGRDMGTIIFPEARLKIFLTASARTRALRRYKQLKDKGENVNLSRLFQEIEARDHRDTTRSVAPLIPAEDAVIIDSTDLSINDVLQKIYKLVEEEFLIN